VNPGTVAALAAREEKGGYWSKRSGPAQFPREGATMPSLASRF